LVVFRAVVNRVRWKKKLRIGLLHALNQSSGAISLHIPWDIPTDGEAIKSWQPVSALRFDAMNSNTFQDQPDQEHSYKFGSLQHVDPAVRRQALSTTSRSFGTAWHWGLMH
jgi:L-rhamnose isomerase